MGLKRLSALVMLALVAALAVGTSGTLVFAQGGQSPDEICDAATQDLSEPETRDFEQAEDVLEEDVDYWAVLCTAQGPVTVDLLEDVAPLAVNNFVFLARQDYFNNTTFHRVLPGFMAQGGDPTATGSGGPGYEFADETNNALVFDRPGLLAMANAGPNTNGSQFFITYTPTPWLDGAHTIFGEVFSGQGAAELLTPRNPEQQPAYDGDTLETVVIVEGADGIVAEADSAPTFEHWQTLLERLIVEQIGAPFVQNADQSGTSTLEERAAAWGAAGGDTLREYMTDYLATNDFMGAATVALAVEECPPVPEDLPFWALRFEVNDYGNEENASAVAADSARSDQLVESGAFESYAEGTLLGGRLYRTPVEDNACGSDGALYRLELPNGRYLLAVEALLDNTVINDETEITPEQFLVYLMDQVLAGSLGGPLQRGNLAE